MNKMYLVISDSFSKWPEIFKVKKADTNNTLIKLKKVFARFGLPNTIVSDNCTPFTSSEFCEFCQYNGIQHLTSPPYHHSSNGAADNSVKTFKLGFKKILTDNENIPIQAALNKYLFYYRNTIYVSTKQTPTSLMLGRNVTL